MATSPEYPSYAIAHSFNNRAEIERSELCACFYCFERFAPAAIHLWTDSDDPRDENPGALRDDTSEFRGTTAICPHCQVDSVIGSASGYALTDDFLRSLHDYWHARKHTT